MQVKCIPGENSLPGGVIFNREKGSLSVWFGDFSVTAYLDHEQLIELGQAMTLPGGPDCICAPTSFCAEKFSKSN